MSKSITMNILNNEVKLDERCWNCTNKFSDQCFIDDNGKCKLCNDTGFILTDTGEAIIKLLLRHKD